MVIHIDSDSSYLSKPYARRHTVGHYYLILQPVDPKKPPKLSPPANVPIHIEYRILRHVVASDAKAEVGGLFHNREIAVPLRITLNELIFPTY